MRRSIFITRPHESSLVAIVLLTNALNSLSLVSADEPDALDLADAAGFRSPSVFTTESPATRQEQAWHWHAQNTDIVQYHPRSTAPYSGPNSLRDYNEVKETVSFDLLAGARLWRGAEAHLDGLVWQGFGLSQTEGIEGFPNGEAVKLGTKTPSFTFARLFIRQVIGLGGELEGIEGDGLHLARLQNVCRLTLTVGRFSAKDIFDNNAYANDPRSQFMNWALMANGAWDYPMDTVGYTTGAAFELDQPKWTVRYGFFQVPGLKNWWTREDRFLKIPAERSAGDGPFLRSWAMVVEFERRYRVSVHPGAIRLLGYLNDAHLGSYQAALTVPGADISPVREYRYKYGFGLNWEQEVVTNLGVFSRLGWNDGRNEGWTFTDMNWSGSLGVSVGGKAWHRPGDILGIAGVISGISRVHQAFFAAGGTDILGGDGRLRYGPEEILETYYDWRIWKAVHAAIDYQFVANPAFNRDRGPAHVFGLRLHADF